MAYQPVEHWSQDMSLAALARIFYDGGIGFEEYRRRRTRLIDAVVRGEIRLRESLRVQQARDLAPPTASSGGSKTYLIGIVLAIALASAAFVLSLLPTYP